MSLLEKPKHQFVAAAVLVALLVAAGVVIYHVNKLDLPEEGDHGAGTSGYSLFGIGGESVFSKNTRDALVKKLGADRIDDWSPIDLIEDEAPFIEKAMPELADLNRRVNYDGGKRAGMDTIKVTYRYARSRKLPFDSIKIVFSKNSKKPVFLKSRLKREGASFVDLLMEKHGEPRVVEGKEGKTRYSWKNRGEFLFITMNRDRQGRPEYHISIYFLNNIRELADKVEKDRKADEERRKGVEESAF